MQCNVGPREQYARLALGAAAAMAAMTPRLDMRWRVPLAVIAAAEIATGLARYCPVNALLSIDNCEDREQEDRPPLRQYRPEPGSSKPLPI